MKRFLSFVLLVTLFVIFSYHNPVMAFGGSMEKISMEEIPMCNHAQVELDQKVVDNKNIDDCQSICCYDKDFGHEKFSNVGFGENKKKIEKIKFNFPVIDLSSFDIATSDLIGNKSPPFKQKYIIKNNYISLIGIVKSNT